MNSNKRSLTSDGHFHYENPTDNNMIEINKMIVQFVNDAKSGRVLPLVTPIEEEGQFMKCMSVSSSVKKELMSDDEDE